MSTTTETPRIHPGQTVENPVTGERFTFTATAASTDGELLAFDFALKPGGAVPMPHVHPDQSERFEVVAGEMRFRVELRTIVAGPGDVLLVEPGVAHSFANAGPDEARLRVEVRPALAMEEMFADVIELAEAGRITARHAAQPPRPRAAGPNLRPGGRTPRFSAAGSSACCSRRSSRSPDGAPWRSVCSVRHRHGRDRLAARALLRLGAGLRAPAVVRAGLETGAPVFGSLAAAALSAVPLPSAVRYCGIWA